MSKHPAMTVSGEQVTNQGRIQEVGGGGTRRPPKFGRNMIFFLRKIVIFHTEYPQNFRDSLRSARFFLSAPLT